MPDSDPKTPGQLIAQLLHERGWSQKVLALVLDVQEAIVTRIISGKRDVDASLALALGEVFEVPAERFMDLQKNYELSRARLTAQPDPSRARRAMLYGSLPISDMIKRGWLGGVDLRNMPAVETGLARHFEADSIDTIPALAHAARKTGALSPTTPAQAAWLHRVKKIAKTMAVPRYSVDKARQAVEGLSSLLRSAEEVRHVPRILAEAGIRFVLVEGLPKGKIDGACLWLDDKSPVIGMSLRNDRIDNFWFTLRHECEHVICNHGKAVAIVDSDIETPAADVPEEEAIANAAASAFCVPPKELEFFILRKQPFFAERDVLGFAARLQIHPGLVVGQLRYRLKRWDLLVKHLVKVRAAVAPSAVVDGWGDVAPVDSMEVCTQ